MRVEDSEAVSDGGVPEPVKVRVGAGVGVAVGGVPVPEMSGRGNAGHIRRQQQREDPNQCENPRISCRHLLKRIEQRLLVE